jgi:hypothetical protein
MAHKYVWFDSQAGECHGKAKMFGRFAGVMVFASVMSSNALSQQSLQTLESMSQFEQALAAVEVALAAVEGHLFSQLRLNCLSRKRGSRVPTIVGCGDNRLSLTRPENRSDRSRGSFPTQSACIKFSRSPCALKLCTTNQVGICRDPDTTQLPIRDRGRWFPPIQNA